MKRFRGLAVFFVIAAQAPAQLTTEQKVADLQQLAAIFIKNYGPYEWAAQTQNFDLFNLSPWLDRAKQTKTDLDFMDLCIEYAASLNDAHVTVMPTSDFQAFLGFDTDIFDGKVLIDFIDRTQLPTRRFPFVVGDELISVDGRSAQDWLDTFYKYSIAANDRSTRRFAAEFITFRAQSLYPYSDQIGDTATVVVQRQSGAMETYTVPWFKTGTAIDISGPVPDPRTASASKSAPARQTVTEFSDPMAKLRNLTTPGLTRFRGILNYDAIAPPFALPAGFKLRLGNGLSDAFLSGTYQSGGYRIGYIRIPDFGPPDTSGATDQFTAEINFMQKNTDGLVIDVMRNPGGDVCYMQDLASLLIPYRFQALGFEVRATAQWILAFSQVVQQAQQFGLSQSDINLYQTILNELQAAFKENRGLTGPLALCGPSLATDPAMDARGNIIAYTKPIVVLIDETTASAGDAFAATMQDNNRGVLMGMRTMGAGGNVVQYAATTYSELSATVTQSLMVRNQSIATSEYPTAPYVENIGVRPDLYYDFMTADNLTKKGSPFVTAFSAAIVSAIQGN